MDAGRERDDDGSISVSRRGLLRRSRFTEQAGHFGEGGWRAVAALF